LDSHNIERKNVK